MAATFGVNNTHQLNPDTGHVSESTKESSVDVATIMDEQGVTVYAGPRRLVTETVTISGKGSVSLTEVAGTPTVALGTTLITSVKQTETNDDFPEFEIQGTIYKEV
jgi:hypothetical protein